MIESHERIYPLHTPSQEIEIKVSDQRFLSCDRHCRVPSCVRDPGQNENSITDSWFSSRGTVVPTMRVKVEKRVVVDSSRV